MFDEGIEDISVALGIGLSFLDSFASDQQASICGELLIQFMLLLMLSLSLVSIALRMNGKLGGKSGAKSICVFCDGKKSE